MAQVSMLTVIPKDLAKQLSQQKTVHEYNTMPQVNKEILYAARDFMRENVGYEELPMACLCKSGGKDSDISANSIFDILPINSRDSVLFQLEMPSDMIVTVDFDTLIEASSSADACRGDIEELGFVTDAFKDELRTGLLDGASDQIIFIPFLDYEKCRFYAKFTENFETEEFSLPGLEKLDVRRITAFM